jgi:hypothetical protein
MEPLIIRGQKIGKTELVRIRNMVEQNWDRGRVFISRKLCTDWEWRQPNGHLKDQVCRILLNRLEEKKLITLPPRKTGEKKGKRRYYIPPEPPPEFCRQPHSGRIDAFAGGIEMKMVRRTPDEALWNYLVHRYHYKSYSIIVGAHLKYIAYLKGQPVACMSWSSTVFRIQCRDTFIGWDNEARSRNNRFMVNNSRFLILPWVRIKNLASFLLGHAAGTISRDWQEVYGYPVYLLETFVDKQRFAGTCYKAANWQLVGETKGHAKKNTMFYYHGQRKDVYLYPLIRDFRKRLGGTA